MNPADSISGARPSRVDFHVRFFGFTYRSKLDSFLYWRTGVLEKSEGLKWESIEDTEAFVVEDVKASAAVTYDILSAGSHKRLPSLEQSMGFEALANGLAPLFDKRRAIYLARESIYRGRSSGGGYLKADPVFLGDSRMEITPRLKVIEDKLANQPLSVQLDILDRLMGGFTYASSASFG